METLKSFGVTVEAICASGASAVTMKYPSSSRVDVIPYGLMNHLRQLEEITTLSGSLSALPGFKSG